MSFEQYKRVIETYQSGNENDFTIAVRDWIENSDINPFELKEPHELFFDAKKYCRKWRNGGIDCRSAKRNMVASVKKIAEMNLAYPLDLIKQEEKEKQEQIKKIEIKKKTESVKKTEPIKKEQPKIEQKKEVPKEEIDDSRYVLLLMAKAYNEHNEVNFKQFAIHLAEITEENMFKEGTPEYDKFEEMKDVYNKHNIRRLVVVAEQLCEIINATEPETKKVIKQEKILGVLPEEEKERKSWLRFLNPWKKENDNT